MARPKNAQLTGKRIPPVHVLVAPARAEATGSLLFSASLKREDIQAQHCSALKEDFSVADMSKGVATPVGKATTPFCMHTPRGGV